ncbi:hypothetical protein [Candidatus Sarmatiella mevalonica]|uniref:hypothetical protein n=1 Tax=Candidatus Sarmatiella mevalonica TaxID=2770581 RepID=UPI00192511B5|nr:hypothetical protein [Candidatus Sarmatiella mevalonica]
MMSKCEEYTKHRAAAYMKYMRTCASTASPQLPSGVELGKRSIVRYYDSDHNSFHIPLDY